MSNRANGRKKSLFPAQTSVLTNASMDYFVNGVNYKIPYTNFVSGLGVTGTIVQEGAVSGTPVLDKQNTVNNIRNLEAGAGIYTAVSSENGITIKHNFTQDTTGSPVLINPTNASPAIASIVAGSGISVTASSNAITIATTGVAKASDIVIVSVLADLPSAVAGAITLLANTEYQLIQDINIAANRIVMGDNCILAGLDQGLTSLTYSGTSDMITSADKTCTVKNLTLSCVNARAFKITDTSAKTFNLNSVTIATCNKIGLFTSTASTYLLQNFNSLITAADGMAFAGVFDRFAHTYSTVNITAGSVYDLGTASFKSFLSDSIVSTLASNSFFVKGAASSANIATGQLGSVKSPFLLGGAASAALSNVLPTDKSWEFTGGNTIADTRTSSLATLQGNSAATVIATAGTPVLIAGVWVAGVSSQMTATTSGRITYNGSKGITATIAGQVSIEPVSGSVINLFVQLALNGTVVAASKVTGNATSGKKTSITLSYAQALVSTDYIELYVSNVDSTVNLLVSSAILRAS